MQDLPVVELVLEQSLSDDLLLLPPVPPFVMREGKEDENAYEHAAAIG